MPTYLLDGVPLDHPAGCWRLQKGTQRRPLPGVRAVQVSLPGRAGELPIVDLDHDATKIGLTFAVSSRTPSGGDGGYEQLEANLEALSALLGVRHRMMELRYRAGPLVRVADVTVTAVSEPEIQPPHRAKLTAVCQIPGVYWRHPTASTWTGNLPGNDQPITTLGDATGPITDAMIRVTGPAVDVSITDVASGGTISRPSGLLHGEHLLLDCEHMRAAIAITDTWDLDDGDDVTGQIDATGPGSAFRWLHLTPVVAAGDPWSRVVLVSASASSTGTASLLEIRARRSYL